MAKKLFFFFLAYYRTVMTANWYRCHPKENTCPPLRPSDNHLSGRHNEANSFRRGSRSCPPMSCIGTSSRISSAHNTKQNKCPLLIKPHNKCRPFVFPFILSTQGERRNEDFSDSHKDKKWQSLVVCRLSLSGRSGKGAWSHCGCYSCRATCNMYTYILSILKFITNNATCKK